MKKSGLLLWFSLVIGVAFSQGGSPSGFERKKDGKWIISNERIGRNQLRDLLLHYDENFNDLTFDHCTFYVDEAKDNVSSFSDSPENVVFFDLVFKNCVFEDPGSIYNYRFKRKVTFQDLSNLDLNIDYNVFDSELFFKSCNRVNLVISNSYIYSASFEKFTGASTFSGSYFNQPAVAFKDSQFKDFQFLSCEFFDDSPEAQKFVLKSRTYVQTDAVNLLNLEAERLTIQDCIFNSVLYFENISVSHSFVFSGNKLEKAMSFKGNIELPLFNTSLKYTDVENKLFTEYAYAEDPITYNTSYKLLGYTDDADFGDDGQLYSKFDSITPLLSDPAGLIAVYSKLLTIFNNNEDNESYNACYKKLKEIEKTASKVAYKNNASIENFFEWKMNEFLDTYCDYGTNPVKSLVFSVWVIAFFCIVYILFPSEEDNLTYGKLTGAVSKYIHHFANRSVVGSEADEAYQLSLKEINLLKEELQTNQQTLPPIVVVFGQPLHAFMLWWAGVKHAVQSFVEFNVFTDWHTLNSRHKWKTTFIITLSLSGFLFWGLIMRLLNAVALSMNAFVTLGYGEIEASGVARYFCVLEGLVGWFLLSIFSVSLISQILQ